MTEKGLIFNIQRFSIHDGPGIRTTVFMKGCPLSCRWCSNPESMSGRPQLMVRDVKCAVCGACVEVCPEKAISLTAEHGRRIDWDSCTQCLECVPACLYEALTAVGRYADVGEVVQEVIRDEVFYKNSGGGVTLSGGEPMIQYEFVRDLLAACKEQGLHTALDTTGFAPEDHFAGVLPYIDLVLFDLKQLDPEKHLEYTGVDNDLILKNGRFIAGKVRTWFRIPLIEGFNDSPDQMRVIAEMAKELGVEKISLLPYHEGGMSKAAQIGRTYQMNEARAPEEERIQELKDIALEVGVEATVGH